MPKTSLPFRLRFMGALLTVIGSLWPRLSSYLAYRLWFSTPRYKQSRREAVWADRASQDIYTVAGKKVVSYRWGAVSPGYVLLVHGWSGRAAQLGAFVNSIQLLGLGAIGFDAPGHGASEGNETNIFEFAETIDEIVKRHGVPRAIITHSFGCMAAALAIRLYDLPTDKLVTISCPIDSYYLVEHFANQFRLNKKVISLFNKKLTSQFGEDIFEKTSLIHNLKDRPVKLLIVHDKNDSVVPRQLGEKLAEAFPDARTIFTENLDHLRLLRDEELIERITGFLDN